MKLNSVAKRVFAVVAIFGLAGSTYLVLVKPWYMSWGATGAEAARVMPGDEIVQEPTFNSTRAVTIDGSPEEIWPWLVQIGYGRAGFYGYDLIENLGSQRGLESAREIIPELQNFQVGDDLPISVVATYKIREMDPGRYLIWADKNDGAFTWGLYPLNDRQTRLVLRFRFRHRWYDYLFTDWADHVAVRKMLLGIKGRVEGQVEPMIYQNVEIATWALAAVEFVIGVILIFKLRRWWWGWLLALIGAGTLLTTLYAVPPVWLSISLEGILLVWLLLIVRISKVKKGRNDLQQNTPVLMQS